MSVELLPVYPTREFLDREIGRLRHTPPYEFVWEQEENSVFAEGWDRFWSDRWAYDCDSIRFQLLAGARKKAPGLVKSAEALCQFFGAFFPFTDNKPWNEFGLNSCAIISPENCRRLDQMFQGIPFSHPQLRKAFETLCRKDKYGFEYRYVKNFEAMVDYASALDRLLLRAVSLNRHLVLYANP